MRDIDVARFWSKVVKTDGCWLWAGTIVRNGGGEWYGQFWLDGKRHLAHRVSFFLANGYWPRIGRHTCDEGLCVRPDHILDGTQKDNIEDSVRRGRARRVSLPGKRAKLNADQVGEIRRRLEAGESQKRIAGSFGVTYVAIGDIARGRTWKTA